MRPVRFTRSLILLSLAVTGVGCASSRGTTDPMALDIAEAEAMVQQVPVAESNWGFLYTIFVETPRRIIDAFVKPSPLESVAKLEDPQFADLRRQGIVELSAKPWGRAEPYTSRYGQIADDDQDWLVRATAIRALNRARDAGRTDVFIRGLADSHEQVRLEAVKALSNTWDAAAAERLRELLASNAESRDLRIAAADALRHDRTDVTYRALVSMLNDRDFGVAWTARRSLRRMTGEDYRFAEADWLRWRTENPL